MEKLRLILYPNKLLRKKCSLYEGAFDSDLKSITDQMINIMHENVGIGLAAPQVGKLLRIVVADISPTIKDEIERTKNKPLVLINPEIIKTSSGEAVFEEGCLSFPNQFADVKRPVQVKIKAKNLFGKNITLKAKDILAVTLQHEVDHLDGELFIDKAIPGTLKTITPKSEYKLIFVGAGPFGEAAYKNLIPKIKPALTITKIDRAKGRGQKVIPGKIAKLAKQNKLNLLQVKSIEETISKIADASPEIILIASWDEVIPKNILVLPKKGSLNLHPSLLPLYRGSTPIQQAILDGAAKTGVCLIKMDSEIDHGQIVAQKETNIKPDDTAASLTSKLAAEGTELIANILPSYLEGKIELKEQNHKNATYTYRLKKEAGLIDWAKPTIEIERQIRAMQSWPNAYTILPDGKRLIIYSAKLKSGRLDLGEVQLEGKQRMQFSQFVQGYRGNIDFANKIVYNK